MYQYKHLIIDFTRKKICVAGVEKKLDAKSWETLEYLFINRARVVNKNEILDSLWKKRSVNSEIITSAIYRIRKAIDFDNDSFIRTIYKIGFQFNFRKQE